MFFSVCLLPCFASLFFVFWFLSLLVLEPHLVNLLWSMEETSGLRTLTRWKTGRPSLSNSWLQWKKGRKRTPSPEERRYQLLVHSRNICIFKIRMSKSDKTVAILITYFWFCLFVVVFFSLILTCLFLLFPGEARFLWTLKWPTCWSRPAVEQSEREAGDRPSIQSCGQLCTPGRTLQTLHGETGQGRNQ